MHHQLDGAGVQVDPEAHGLAEGVDQRVLFVDTAGKRALLTEILRDEALGRTLVYNPVPERAARARMLRSGLPEILVSAILEQWALVASGRGAEISFAVQEILERPPATFDVWLARRDPTPAVSGGWPRTLGIPRRPAP